MSILFALTMLAAPPADDWRQKCAAPETDKERSVCAYLERIDSLEIETVESVAVGTREQMLPVRSKARECGLMNRIDYVGTRVAVFDIINADENGRKCLIPWIKENTPQLVFSEEKIQALLDASALPNEK